MKRIAVVLIFGLLSLGLAAPATATDLGRTFETSDGTLRFSYPDDWKEYAHDGYVSVLSPLVAKSPNGHLRDGEAKVEFYIGRSPTGDSLAEMKRRECNKRQEDARIVDCRITTFNGRTWLWVLKLEEAFGGIWVRLAATIENGRSYRGVGLVPSGERYREGLAATKEILLSAHVEREGLAATGSPLIAIGLVGLALLLTGGALRLRGSRS